MKLKRFLPCLGKKPEDPFLTFIKSKDDEKRKEMVAALEFGRRAAYTSSGLAFYRSCKYQFDKKKFLTPRQIATLNRLDEALPDRYGSYCYDGEDGYYRDDDFDPFDP